MTTGKSHLPTRRAASLHTMKDLSQRVVRKRLIKVKASRPRIRVLEQSEAVSGLAVIHGRMPDTGRFTAFKRVSMYICQG